MGQFNGIIEFCTNKLSDVKDLRVRINTEMLKVAIAKSKGKKKVKFGGRVSASADPSVNDNSLIDAYVKHLKDVEDKNQKYQATIRFLLQTYELQEKDLHDAKTQLRADLKKVGTQKETARKRADFLNRTDTQVNDIIRIKEEAKEKKTWYYTSPKKPQNKRTIKQHDVGCRCDQKWRVY